MIALKKESETILIPASEAGKERRLEIMRCRSAATGTLVHDREGVIKWIRKN